MDEVHYSRYDLRNEEKYSKNKLTTAEYNSMTTQKALDDKKNDLSLLLGIQNLIKEKLIKAKEEVHMITSHNESLKREFVEEKMILIDELMTLT